MKYRHLRTGMCFDGEDTGAVLRVLESEGLVQRVAEAPPKEIKPDTAWSIQEFKETGELFLFGKCRCCGGSTAVFGADRHGNKANVSRFEWWHCGGLVDSEGRRHPERIPQDLINEFKQRYKFVEIER